MRSATRRVLKGAAGLPFAAMIVCFVIAGLFDARKHTVSKVPTRHFVVIEDGHPFYVEQGGPPVDQRPHFPLTDEQYRLWEENTQASSLWVNRAALCFIAGLGILAWAWMAEPWPWNAAESDAPADQPRD